MAAIASAPEEMREVPPTAPELSYPGSVVAEVSAERARFSRVVKADKGLENDAPGTRIIFRTDAKVILAQFQANGLRVRDAVNGVGAVVVDGKKTSNYAIDGPGTGILNVPVLNSADATLRDIEIWLPYAESVDFLGLTVNKTARILPMTLPNRPRYVAYGDSITQGYRAADALATYPVLVAKARGWELTNLDNDAARECAIQSCVPSIDLPRLLAARDAPLDSFWSEDQIHLSPSGNRLYAQPIFESLTAQALLTSLHE